jgi:Motility quorum-sensing regulator, toxin of MqsA
VAASYFLATIKQLVSAGRYLITVTALETAAIMGFDDESIVECIVEQLAETHFYKTMPARAVAGLMQDVYKISFEGSGFTSNCKSTVPRTQWLFRSRKMRAFPERPA